MWHNTDKENYEKGKTLLPILLKVGFAMKQGTVNVLAQKIQFAGMKWQDRHNHVSMDVVNNITAMFSPTNKKETQALGCWRFRENAYSRLQSECKPSLSHDP